MTVYRAIAVCIIKTLKGLPKPLAKIGANLSLEILDEFLQDPEVQKVCAGLILGSAFSYQLSEETPSYVS